jgi:hypothetical protein
MALTKNEGEPQGAGGVCNARAPYREAITKLSDARMLELDAGESMRALRLNIARAAKEVNRPVDVGVSAEGTLLVWLQDKPKQKRGPRRK